MQRRITRIMLLLFLGAMTTIAVAQAFAWLHPAFPSASGNFKFRTGATMTAFLENGLGSHGTRVEVARTLGTELVRVEMGELIATESAQSLLRTVPLLADDQDLAQGLVDSWNHGEHGSARDVLPWWCASLVSIDDVPLDDFERRMFAAHGWPLPALCWEYQPTFGGGHESPGAITRTHSRGLHFIPYRPVALGFIIDTLIFAAGWWMSLFGFSAMRRTVRRRHGRCETCGYDLHGRSDKANTRPECGAAIAAGRAS